jgi:FixJ family two-component response regulator
VKNTFVKTVSLHWNLSRRETDVIQAVLEGQHAVKDLASALGLAESTVEHHVAAIARKAKQSGHREVVRALAAWQGEFLSRITPSALLKAPQPAACVIDDEPDVSALFVAALSHAGLRSCARDFRSSSLLADIEAFNPDVVILDYKLGEVDGLEIAREVQKGSVLAPTVIIMTGYPERLSDQGPHFYHVVPKPVAVSTLVRAAHLGAAFTEMRRHLVASIRAA